MEILTRRTKQVLRDLFPKSVAYMAYLKALFENEIELRLLARVCDQERTSIDVGAFTGTYTIGAFIHSKDVIAVEPQPRQVEALRRSMPGNVKVVEAALSNISGQGVLEMETIKGGSMSRLNIGPSVTDGWVKHPVRLMRMDDLCRERVGFVKIDAEGHELEVLEGASRIIESDRPIFVIEAEDRYRKGAVEGVALFLRQFGYDGYFVYRGKLRGIGEYDPKRHQDLNLLVAGPRRAYADYINNFIFAPREEASKLPREAPSALRVLYETIFARRAKMRTS